MSNMAHAQTGYLADGNTHTNCDTISALITDTLCPKRRTPAIAHNKPPNASSKKLPNSIFS